MPPGASFEFIVEKEKLSKIRKVVEHNEGRILKEDLKGNDATLQVQKITAKPP